MLITEGHDTQMVPVSMVTAARCPHQLLQKVWGVWGSLGGGGVTEVYQSGFITTLTV